MSTEDTELKTHNSKDTIILKGPSHQGSEVKSWVKVMNLLYGNLSVVALVWIVVTVLAISHLLLVRAMDI